MIREQRARWLAVGSTVVVVALAGVFALVRNVPAPPGVATAGTVDPDVVLGDLEAAPDPARVAAGRDAFERMRCAACHAIGGLGNPSHPLDGVGSRRDRAALRDGTLGEGPAAEGMSARVIARKRANVDDPQLEELLDFLQAAR
jgi:mono/diheme cytochrome c family protein